VTLSIAPATPADVAAIVDLLAEIDRYYGGSAPETPDDRAALTARMLFGERPAAYVLLARDDAAVIGMAAYSYLWPAAGATHSLFLKELYVRDNHRQTGAGRALMSRLAEIADDAGCSRIEWTADHGNEPAEQFYQALGVTPDPSKPFYRVEDITARRQAWAKPS